MSPAPIGIVGAGPTGLIAAETLAAEGREVVVFEAMPSPARKLLMAGRGGLNLTHSEPLPRFLAHYGKDAPPALVGSIEAFPPEALVAWANRLGQETFVGSSGRIFPKSLKASPLLRAWLRRLDGQGVELRTRKRWTGWDQSGALQFVDDAGRESLFQASATLLALGGASWPRLGSDGRWVDILASIGVPVAPIKPANAGVLIAWSEHLSGRFAGEPLKRIAVSHGGVTRRGEAVATRTGLEGGVIYAFTRELRTALARGETPILTLDLRPDLDTCELARRLSVPRGKQSASNFLRKAAGISPAAIALTREACRGPLPAEPEGLARLIKAAALEVRGVAGLERAISSAGGVSFDGLDEYFMLKARPGVFVAGEMLDWEAPTGGYLLQATFATGVAAARGLSRWLAGLEEAEQ